MPTTPLDHRNVAELALVERYHQGRLSADEEERFEAHFVDCAACQQELEAQRSFLRGLRTVAAEEAAGAALRRGLLAWLARRGPGSARLAASALAVALVALGLATAVLWRQNQRLEERAAELGAPVAALPVVLLGTLRGDDDPPAVAPPAEGPWALAVDVGADPRFSGYSLALTDAAGTVRFARGDLAPNDLEVIQLLVPAGVLAPGEYRLLARGTLPGGEEVEVASHRFRVTP